MTRKAAGLWLMAPPSLAAQGIEEVRSDVMNIANRLAEEVDPDLGLYLNKVTGQYEVRYANPKTGTSALVCQVDPKELDGRLISNLKALDMWRHDMNSKRQADEQRAEAAKDKARRDAELEALHAELAEELEGRLSERESLRNVMGKTRGISVPRSVKKDAG